MRGRPWAAGCGGLVKEHLRIAPVASGRDIARPYSVIPGRSEGPDPEISRFSGAQLRTIAR
ncbi:hypothetical protein BRAS3843_170007 [Bradyrhizobium sp. STM 3843]|nr:hypothetical protein BRAS3843_170007 [Bradyrhizobium sp. STM 3843]